MIKFLRGNTNLTDRKRNKEYRKCDVFIKVKQYSVSNSYTSTFAHILGSASHAVRLMHFSLGLTTR